MNKITRMIFILLFIPSITSCKPMPAQPPATETARAEPNQAGTSTNPVISNTEAVIKTTQNDLSGNHMITGSVDLRNAFPLDIPISGKPLWLVSAPFEDGALFAVVMDNGAAQAFKVAGKNYASYDISPAQLPAGMPPTLAVAHGRAQLILPPEDASPLTNPLLIRNKLVYISINGDLVYGDARLPINALPDARILVDESHRLLILTQPATRYDHGIVGDKLEATGITLVETEPEFRILQNIEIEAPDVIEGIAPIWADINQDGIRDIIITLSNSQSGARIAAFREDGTLLAESPAIGLGYRWRHQIAVTKFNRDTPPLLVSIRTPHIGGVVEFLQFNDGKFEVVSEVEGFSSHSIGSRNLDSALAGDFNNDGIIELLAPDQSHTNLGIISFNGVTTLLPLDGTLTSNISAAKVNGRLVVGAGIQDYLKIWIP